MTELTVHPAAAAPRDLKEWLVPAARDGHEVDNSARAVALFVQNTSRRARMVVVETAGALTMLDLPAAPSTFAIQARGRGLYSSPAVIMLGPFPPGESLRFTYPRRRGLSVAAIGPPRA